jgi:hypothetical protein
VSGLRQEKYLELAAEYEIELVSGDARLVTGPAITIGDRRIEAAHYLIATGAEPQVPDIPGLAETGFLTSTTAMELDHLPESLLVIGSGYVALEQAQLFAHLGARAARWIASPIPAISTRPGPVIRASPRRTSTPCGQSVPGSDTPATRRAAASSLGISNGLSCLGFGMFIFASSQG